MKWIALKNGRLVNLEQVAFIHGLNNNVVFFDTSATPECEIFSTPAEANARLEELKKMLVEEK